MGNNPLIPRIVFVLRSTIFSLNFQFHFYVLNVQVNTDWTKQIKATASPCASTESDQVDICITIAMKCVDGERNNRPTVAEIVHILNS